MTVEPPPLLNGAERSRLRLRFDVFDSRTSSGSRRAATRPSDNPVIVDKELSENLGLERFWQYEQVATERAARRS